MALIAIAGMALIAMACFQAVSTSSELMRTLQREAAIERTLVSAEAEATFVYLTSAPVRGGILTTEQERPEEIFFEGIDTEKLNATEFWSAAGSPRVSRIEGASVAVTFRDASGLPPIRHMTEEQMATFFAGAGLEGDAAAEMAARVADYQDEDFVRRFRGAERSDYRLYSASPPSDSPLRAYEELSRVLGFSRAAGPETWEFVAAHLGVGGSNYFMKTPFAPPAVVAITPRDQANAGQDALENFVTDDLTLTDRARFLLSVQLEPNKVRRRTIEIERTAVAADRPFGREWIYDAGAALGEPAYAELELNGLAEVYQTTPDPDPR
ncbi:MAG: general secretion pathway protein GspK [Rhodomicrobium sp.]|nr:general secretion pathway protein GspK [Rhodomicrobium sp.]